MLRSRPDRSDFGPRYSGPHLHHLGGIRDATQETPIVSTRTGDTAGTGGLVHDGPDRTRSFSRSQGEPVQEEVFALVGLLNSPVPDVPGVWTSPDFNERCVGND